MKFLNIYGLGFVVATTLRIAVSASAQDLFFISSSGSYDVAANWSNTNCNGAGGAGVPTANDAIEICANKTAHVDSSEACKKFLVRAGAAIEIEDEFDLTIAGSGSGSGESTIESGGRILLDDAGDDDAYKTFLIFTGTHVVYGGGEIHGGDSEADIKIDNGAGGGSLTVYTTVRGVLMMSGPGSFANYGTVKADGDGQLWIGIEGSLTDIDLGGGLPSWQCRSAGAMLRFDASIADDPDLAGEWYVTAGLVYVDQRIVTSGRLEMTGGEVDVRKNLTMGSPYDQDQHYLHMSGGKIRVRPNRTFLHKGADHNCVFCTCFIPSQLCD